ncbi:hypothetical protein PSTG_03002 [Puccinia striiformis f. sp. tritici PST-78]|uniref:Uncharacterized protein n=1 Tax=Puccinia striiformis f. sp. tritici PST-78 TaxID=1165861 RepID=A0A0L0VY14_9BASI|nr:hypothetical protein PSTG_03002 [Puccinia striiformis f. sp. tritici PST-78]
MLKGLDKIFLDKARTTPFDPLIHHMSRPASDTESPSPRMCIGLGWQFSFSRRSDQRIKVPPTQWRVEVHHPAPNLLWVGTPSGLSDVANM